MERNKLRTLFFSDYGCFVVLEEVNIEVLYGRIWKDVYLNVDSDCVVGHGGLYLQKF